MWHQKSTISFKFVSLKTSARPQEQLEYYNQNYLGEDKKPDGSFKNCTNT